ncbi:DUF4238 domain-containing protein [[Clostridium] innocuum]|nr:DUF4238 domain-containing protein [[Clostridium] innocuum]
MGEKYEKKNKQHIVPKTYLKNFCYTNDKPFKIFSLDKRIKKIINTNADDIAQERNFYTVDRFEDKYIWENFYAENIEPMMQDVIEKTLQLCELNVLTKDVKILEDTERKKLAVIIVCQMLRDRHTRDYGKLILEQESPKILAEIKSMVDEIGNKKASETLSKFTITDGMFKEMTMQFALDPERCSQFANILYSRSWVLCKCKSSVFVTSDSPVVIMNMNTLNTTPFKNGIADDSTVIFYPLSSKVLLALYSPNILWGSFDLVDSKVIQLDVLKDKKFIDTMNKKQLEHCYRQIYCESDDILNNLIGK